MSPFYRPISGLVIGRDVFNFDAQVISELVPDIMASARSPQFKSPAHTKPAAPGFRSLFFSVGLTGQLFLDCASLVLREKVPIKIIL